MTQATPAFVVLTQRARARSMPLNRFDPVYRLLEAAIFSSFFQPRLPGSQAPPCAIETSEALFLLENLAKHRIIVWLNIVAAMVMATLGDGSGVTTTGGRLDSLLLTLIAPLVVSGVAWYTISFSGIPERFSTQAMLVTGVLFFVMSVATTALMITLAQVLPWSTIGFVVAPIYVAAYASAVLYDNLDGLRTAAFQPVVFSRAQTYGQPQRADVVHEAPTDLTASVDPRSQVFSDLAHHLDHLLEQLAKQQHPMFANVLIADSLKELVRLFSLTARPVELNADFDRLMRSAHELSIEEVNRSAVHCLRLILERFHALLGDAVVNDVVAITERLVQIEELRADTSADEPPQLQALADFLFVEVFRQLVSIARANRTRLLALRG
jgi:hypothetical protein